MNCTHVQRVTRELWRLLEVYLFFVVSVLGCTGLGKAPSSLSSKSKGASERRIEKSLPLQSKTTLIAPPKFVIIGSAFQARDAFAHLSCAKEEATDDDAAPTRIFRSPEKTFSNAFYTPLLGTVDFYLLNLHSSKKRPADFIADLTALNLLQISTPLLT